MGHLGKCYVNILKECNCSADFCRNSSLSSSAVLFLVLFYVFTNADILRATTGTWVLQSEKCETSFDLFVPGPKGPNAGTVESPDPLLYCYTTTTTTTVTITNDAYIARDLRSLFPPPSERTHFEQLRQSRFDPEYAAQMTDIRGCEDTITQSTSCLKVPDLKESGFRHAM